MRGVGKEVQVMAAKRKDFIEAAYRMFCETNITSVSLQDIADEANYGIATLYRYFTNKTRLVVECATVKWNEFLEANMKRRPSKDFSGMTAAEIFEFYLDSFLELYRNNRDILRFNQFFNVYIQAEEVEEGVMKPYFDIIDTLRESFHEIYVKAQEDQTLRTDESEEKVFSTTLHLMLAAVTRYAVGLVYIPENGFDAEEELEVQKEALYRRYLKA